mgnify:CR=1 FL=1
MSRIDDWFNVPQIEEDDQIQLGENRVYATLEIDHNGVPFYTVTHYTILGAKFQYGKLNPTELDQRIEHAALLYWTDARMLEKFEHHDAGLDHQIEIAREVRSETIAYHEAVL